MYAKYTNTSRISSCTAATAADLSLKWLLLGVIQHVRVNASIFAARLCLSKLTEEVVGWSFRGDMEYMVLKTKKPGSNPATDAAVIAITTVAEKALPMILFEYKPVVDLRSDAVNQDHIMEVLI